LRVRWDVVTTWFVLCIWFRSDCIDSRFWLCCERRGM
jgi:hypothetical protein